MHLPHTLIVTQPPSVLSHSHTADCDCAQLYNTHLHMLGSIILLRYVALSNVQ